MANRYDTGINPKNTTGLAKKSQINEEGVSWKIKIMHLMLL
jgi:hypothetical protein